jgi:hypothetical protein
VQNITELDQGRDRHPALLVNLMLAEDHRRDPPAEGIDVEGAIAGRC